MVTKFFSVLIFLNLLSYDDKTLVWFLYVGFNYIYECLLLPSQLSSLIVSCLYSRLFSSLLAKGHAVAGSVRYSDYPGWYHLYLEGISSSAVIIGFGMR